MGLISCNITIDGEICPISSLHICGFEGRATGFHLASVRHFILRNKDILFL